MADYEEMADGFDGEQSVDDTEDIENMDLSIEEEEEDEGESLDSLTEDETQEETEADDGQEEEQGTGSEPGYVQRRIEKALQRERASIKAEIQAEMEAQYAPLRERLLEMDAKELVQKGVVKDIETARELVRYRTGQQTAKAVEPQEDQPRNEKGQYASQEDQVIQTKIDFLAAQADKIKAKTGIDVIEIFSKNNDIKNAVINGEMDFYDVAEQAQQNIGRRKPPAPTRSSNGASGQAPNAIENMTREQFARMEKKISEGARYSLR